MGQFDIDNIYLLFAHFTPLIMILIIIAIGLSSGLAGAGALAVFIVSIVVLQLIVTMATSWLYIKPDEDDENYLNYITRCAPRERTFIDIIGEDNSSIGMSIAHMMFTLVYTITSMFLQNNVNILYIILFVLIIIHYIYQFNKQDCLLKYARSNTVLGCIGLFFGFLTVLLFFMDDNLLLFSKENSNNKQCGKEGGQRLKCKVYKNGKLIQ